jgi:SAM-dependent methyltransferase
MLPHSDPCERNKGPILQVLRKEFADRTHVLEIGSGTGQHAVYFTTEMPWLVWQPSELPESMAGLRKRIFSEGPKNLRAPVEIDVTTQPWDVRKVDAIFTANTLHIMHWPQVEAFFAGLPAIAKPGTVLAIYGPFRYDGRYTSGSNESFRRDAARARSAVGAARLPRRGRARACGGLRVPRGPRDACEQPDAGVDARGRRSALRFTMDGMRRAFRDNLVAITSLVVALSALGYNTGATSAPSGTATSASPASRS